jgi:putative membrane protein
MWHHYGIGFGFGWAMVGLGVLLVGAIIALIVLAFKRLWPQRTGSGDIDPLDIIKARYARGEITKDQFEQMKKDLTQS